MLTRRTGVHSVAIGRADHRGNGLGGGEGGGHGGDGCGDPVVQPPPIPLCILINLLRLRLGRANLHWLDVRYQGVCVTLGDNRPPLPLASQHRRGGGGDIAECGGCEDCGRGRAGNKEKLRLA